jgi:hypothetical protein
VGQVPLRRVNTSFTARRVAINWAQQGVGVEFKLQYVAPSSLQHVRLAADPAWIEVYDGGSWHQLTNEPRSGYDLGAMSAGDKKTLTFKVTVPNDTPRRRERVDLLIGEES